LKPDYPEANLNRGLSKNAKGDLDGAIADFTHAIDKNPTLAEFYSGRGAVWFRKREYDKAIADLDQAIKYNRNLSGAYLMRGTFKEAKGDWDGALADINEYILFEPETAKLAIISALPSNIPHILSAISIEFPGQSFLGNAVPSLW